MPLTRFRTPAPAAPDHAARQRLFDVYGGVLTDHQREACRLHLDEDWSITELAEHLSCTRSGAHDLVRRALAQLENLEVRLGLAAELDRRDRVEAGLREQVHALGGRGA
ncbi:transcriptional regulator [Candidatus Aeolococcus gillhamiae]|uniref:transcriptional regulator n=1 Tax=Candidatus Aeolococcus gillhamiae TaxID=3127015 RepID=UPI003077014B